MSPLLGTHVVSWVSLAGVRDCLKYIAPQSVGTPEKSGQLLKRRGTMW